MKELLHLGNNSVLLPTVRDSLKIRVKESDGRKFNLFLLKKKKIVFNDFLFYLTFSIILFLIFFFLHK